MYWPTAVRRSGAPATFGQGRPAVAQDMSQTTRPSTSFLLTIISVLSRVWMPDQTLCRGSAAAFVQTLQG